MAKRPDPHSWLFTMLLLSLGISVGATSADVLLTTSGFPPQSGLVLVAMVCAITALRAPQPVADWSLHWRVGLWGAKIMTTATLAVHVISTAVVPPRGQVLTGAVAGVVSVLFVGWVVDQWARRWSHPYDQAQREPQEKRHGRDGEGDADGQRRRG